MFGYGMVNSFAFTIFMPPSIGALMYLGAMAMTKGNEMFCALGVLTNAAYIMSRRAAAGRTQLLARFVHEFG